jgi:hypothetical protein
LAFVTSEDHFPPEPVSGANELKRKDMVPEKTPSMRVTLSPVAMRSLSVEMMGRPAPTEDSWYIRPPDGDKDALNIDCHSSRELEKAFLFGVQMEMPAERKEG